LFYKYNKNYSETIEKSLAFTGLKIDFFTKVKAEYIIEQANKRFVNPANISALDIGCGVGNIHPLLIPHFGALTGIDVSAASIETAKEKNVAAHYDTYKGDQLPYRDNTFDLALSLCVMHHVNPHSWHDFVADLRRVLEPRGLAIVLEHDPANPLTSRVVNQCPFDKDAVLLKKRQLLSIFKQSGFEEVQARYILTIPAGNSFLRRVDTVFSLIPLGAQYYVLGIKN